MVGMTTERRCGCHVSACDSDVRASLASDNSSLTDTERSINQTQHSQAAVSTKNPHGRGLDVSAATCDGRSGLWGVKVSTGRRSVETSVVPLTDRRGLG